MTADDYLLPPLYRAVHDTPGWATGTHLSDEYGRIAFRAEHPVIGPALIAAKGQLWRGQISITPKIVSAGLTHPRRTIIVCIGEDPTLDHAYAFDPRVVANQGDRRTIDRSKRARDVPAFHVDPHDHGATVSALLAGRASLPMPVRGRDGARQSTLVEVSP